MALGPMTELPLWEEILRLLAAALAGAIVGLDREAKSRPAGFRTNTLVALGSAAFTLIALMLVRDLTDDAGLENVDPTRIIAYIISGVGFLGAGAIIQARGQVLGLTTAAGIWVVASIGMAFGAGYYVLGSITLAVAMIVLRAMRLVPIDKMK